ncbi:inositol monophosphatase family protein [Streptomyces sp. NPDC086082]|uniref:inositol monophosphatase family protein n=1 Tax=Streptomyces sp. NPDC086082 TaxID=3365750 RepID=UPI00382EF90C
MIDLSNLFSICSEVVDVVEQEASEIPERSLKFRNPAQVHTKSSIGDVITELDRKVEANLIRRLGKVIPTSRVIGEEYGQHGHGSTNWVIDPIDGSTNVLHGMPHAAVSVALCEGSSARIGVVHNPFNGKTYYATSEGGAFVHTAGTPVDKHRDQRIQVSPNSLLSQSLLGFGLPYDRDRSEEIFSAASRAFSRCQDLRRRGSAALDIISVATGELDGYFELDLRVWDVAAAELILREAGGLLTSWGGDDLEWDTSENKFDVLATNTSVHSALQRVLVE